MTDHTRAFGTIAQRLARNPLGILALFIVLVYGIASLVTAFAGSFSAPERLVLIYFLVAFPVLVLLVFAWLVSRHSSKLFAPSDFRDEGNYLRALSAAASLGAAAVAAEGPTSEARLRSVVESVRESAPATTTPGTQHWRDHVLWVDDRPQNNVNERRAFEAMGLRFTLARSTTEALEKISREQFAVIISDMGRQEGPAEGYVLLDALRRRGDQTPFFIYAGSGAPEHRREANERGAQGSTNRPEELFRMVMSAVVSR